jgi:hypothetical protein
MAVKGPAGIPGLALRVTDNGGKSWCAFYLTVQQQAAPLHHRPLSGH